MVSPATIGMQMRSSNIALEWRKVNVCSTKAELLVSKKTLGLLLDVDVYQMDSAKPRKVYRDVPDVVYSHLVSPLLPYTPAPSCHIYTKRV